MIVLPSKLVQEVRECGSFVNGAVGSILRRFARRCRLEGLFGRLRRLRGRLEWGAVTWKSLTWPVLLSVRYFVLGVLVCLSLRDEVVLE